MTIPYQSFDIGTTIGATAKDLLKVLSEAANRKNLNPLDFNPLEFNNGLQFGLNSIDNSEGHVARDYAKQIAKAEIGSNIKHTGQSILNLVETFTRNLVDQQAPADTNAISTPLAV